MPSNSSTSTVDNATPAKRIAAIDLGTNSFHAVIVDIYPDGSFRTVDKLKEMVILAEKGMGHNLTEEAMVRGLAALKKIRILCDSQGVEEILAYATSAIREADNGGEFIQRMIDEVGIKAHAISGRMEAVLIAHAVRHAVKIGDEPVLMVDIGGGSVEFIVAGRQDFFFTASKKIGVARMAARFISTDPVGKREKQKLRKHFRKELKGLFEALEQHPVDTIIGSSGTMENIARMIANRISLSASLSLNELEVTAAEYLNFHKYFIGLARERRLDVSGLEEKRVDIIAPGLVLLKLLIKELDIKLIRISESALREGMILHYIKKERRRLELLPKLPGGNNPRRRSVFELLRKCDWHEKHSTHVTEMALQLYDVFREELDLPEGDRELLEYAGYLHDIGYYISHRKHHKHALYLIRNADLRGFREEEIEIIAHVARYHRRSTPKSRHKYYERLDSDLQRRIRNLSGILRVADGLDRSHYQNVRKLEIETTGEEVRLYITTEGDPELEIWGAMRKRRLLEEITGRELVIHTKEEGEIVKVDQPDPFPEHKA